MIVIEATKMTAKQRAIVEQRRNAALAPHRTRGVSVDAPRCPCGFTTLKRAQARGRANTHQPFCTFYKPERRARAV